MGDFCYVNVVVSPNNLYRAQELLSDYFGKARQVDYDKGELTFCEILYAGYREFWKLAALDDAIPMFVRAGAGDSYGPSLGLVDPDNDQYITLGVGEDNFPAVEYDLKTQLPLERSIARFKRFADRANELFPEICNER